MADATFNDVITQLKFNNKSEAGRDGRTTMALKEIAKAMIFMGANIQETKDNAKKDSEQDDEKSNKQNSALIQGFKGVAKDMKLTDVATNITSPITGFFKSLPGLIPGGTKVVDATKAAGKKVASAFEVEKNREDQRAKKEQTSILRSLLKATISGFSSLLKGISKSVGMGLAGLLAPLFLVSGFLSQIVTELRFILGFFKKIPGADKVKSIAQGFISVLGKYFNAFKGFFFASPDAKKITLIQKFFGAISKFIKGTFNFFAKGVSLIGRLIRPIVAGFTEGFKLVKGFATSVGSFLAKLLFPITIIIAVFDSISGFIEDWQASEGETMFAKITDAIGGGLGKLFGNLIGIPLDLLTRAVSWLLGKMGFENAEKFLDEFVKGGGFASLIRKLIDAPFNFLSRAIDGMVKFFTENDIGNKISSVFSGSVNVIENFFKKILRTILPIGDENGNWYDIKNLISKAIPDAVYEYAGLNPKTGEMTALDEPQLNLRTEDIEALSSSREMQRQGDVVVNNIDQSVNSQNSQNNSMLSGNYIDPDGAIAQNTY